jgi:uncharacterized protein (DUF2345 family)
MIDKHYRVKHPDGSYQEGITDGEGKTHLLKTAASKDVMIEVQE